MSHPVELCMILSYVIFCYNFSGFFIIFLVLGLLAPLVYFYLIRFVCFLLSSTPGSNKMWDWGTIGGSSIFCSFLEKKVIW